MIDIVNRYTKAVLYHSKTAQTIAEAAVEAVKRGSNLCDSNLCGSNLRGANLCGANLCDSNLCGSNLRGANLCGANLCDASLRGASLCDASLLGANLCGANLLGADLRDANLLGAKNYVSSHAVFSEIVRRQPIEIFPDAEWAAIGQIIVHRPCWETIHQRYAEVAPHVLDVLAEAGFTEWKRQWATLTKENRS